MVACRKRDCAHIPSRISFPTRRGPNAYGIGPAIRDVSRCRWSAVRPLRHPTRFRVAGSTPVRNRVRAYTCPCPTAVSTLQAAVAGTRRRGLNEVLPLGAPACTIAGYTESGKAASTGLSPVGRVPKCDNGGRMRVRGAFGGLLLAGLASGVVACGAGKIGSTRLNSSHTS